MSFILDALKKLEREKETREPGVLMVGPVQWGAPERRQPYRQAVRAGAALAMVAAAAALWWLFASPAPPAAAPPAPAPVAVDTPPPLPRKDPEAPARKQVAGSIRAEAPSPPAVPPSRALVLPREPTEGVVGLAGGTVIQDPAVLPETPDPTDAGTPTPTTSEYRLTAISERDGQPIALLNDRLVREGDQFEGLTILRIGTTEIEIEVKGERRTIGF